MLSNIDIIRCTSKGDAEQDQYAQGILEKKHGVTIAIKGVIPIR